MDTAEIVALAVTIGSLLTAVAAVNRLRLDRQTAPADMSAKLTMAASEFIDDLREENRRLREKIVKFEEREEKDKLEKGKLSLEVNQSRERITALETKIEDFENENIALETKIEDLENEILTLNKQVESGDNH